MTPSAHKNSTMAKSTATSPITLNNPAQPPYDSKNPIVSHAPIGKTLDDSVNKLHPNTANTEKTPENDDAMHLPDDELDDDTINSVDEPPLLIHSTMTWEIT